MCVCILVGYYWGRDVVREGSILGSHTSIISGSIMNSMALFVFSEVMFFSGFFVGILYNLYAGEVAEEILLGVQTLDPLGIPLLNTVLLLSSGVVATLAHEIYLASRLDLVPLFYAILLGVVFFWYQYVEFSSSDFGIATGIFGSCFFSLTGFHRFHVVVRLMLLVLPAGRVLFNTYYGKSVGLDCSMIY